MTFETLNNNVMLVELSVEEMKNFHITYDSLNNDNDNTKSVIKNLLCCIDVDNRIARGEKVTVEALPIADGGCFFIFTFSSAYKKRYRLKKGNCSVVFSVDTLDNLLDLIGVCKKQKKAKGIWMIYKMDNRYYLFTPSTDEKTNDLISEFGEQVDKITYSRVIEHGRDLGKVYLQ